MTIRDLGKLALSSALGLVLSSSFVFLAALPIRYLRLGFGRLPFLLVTIIGTSALMAAEQWQWGLVYFSLSFLVGLFSELESQKISLFLSASIAIFMTTAVSVFCYGLIARLMGLTLFGYLEQQLEPLKAQLSSMPQLEGLTELTSIVVYLPSGLVIGLMVILFIALSVFSDESGAKNSLLLKSFRLPDAGIWFFMAALGAAFLLKKESLEAVVAINALSIVVAAYFFQGLAVAAVYLDHYRVVGIWRMLIYFIIFFQLFIFISGLGIIDYWVDFRSRLVVKRNSHSRGEEKL